MPASQPRAFAEIETHFSHARARRVSHVCSANAAAPLTFMTQAGNPALVNLAVTPGANPPGTDASVTFTALTLPVGQTRSSVVNLTIVD